MDDKLSAHLRHNAWTVLLCTGLEITRRFLWAPIRVEKKYLQMRQMRGRGRRRFESVKVNGELADEDETSQLSRRTRILADARSFGLIHISIK